MYVNKQNSGTKYPPGWQATGEMIIIWVEKLANK